MSASSPAPVIADIGDFDLASGSLIERVLFNHRRVVVIICLLVTAVLGWQATHLDLNASFEKTIPAHHPYVQNFLRYQSELSGLGNAVRIAVVNTKGSIYDAAYLETLRQLSDEVFLVPGVAREQMKSLWTPTTRWATRCSRSASKRCARNTRRKAFAFTSPASPRSSAS